MGVPRRFFPACIWAVILSCVADIQRGQAASIEGQTSFRIGDDRWAVGVSGKTFRVVFDGNAQRGLGHQTNLREARTRLSQIKDIIQSPVDVPEGARREKVYRYRAELKKEATAIEESIAAMESDSEVEHEEFELDLAEIAQNPAFVVEAWDLNGGASADKADDEAEEDDEEVNLDVPDDQTVKGFLIRWAEKRATAPEGEDVNGDLVGVVLAAMAESLLDEAVARGYEIPSEPVGGNAQQDAIVIVGDANEGDKMVPTPADIAAGLAVTEAPAAEATETTPPATDAPVTETPAPAGKGNGAQAQKDK